MQNIFDFLAPTEELAPYIRQIMVADTDLGEGETTKVLPSGYSYLHWLISGFFSADVDGGRIVRNNQSIYVAGVLHSHEINTTFGGRFRYMVTEFSAIGCYQLTGLSGAQCKGTVIDLDESAPGLLDLCVSFLNQAEKLFAAKSRTALFELQQAFIRELAQNSHEVPDYIVAAVKEIERVSGMVKINDVCDLVGVSPRQLNRKFTEIVGLSPKFFARVLQLNKAMQAVMHDDREYLVRIANTAGYFDESHFIHTARNIFRESPLGFLHSDQELWFEYIKQSQKIKIQ